MRKARLKRLHTTRLYLYNFILERAKPWGQKASQWCPGAVGGRNNLLWRGMREREPMAKLHVWIAVVVTWVHAFVRFHRMYAIRGNRNRNLFFSFLFFKLWQYDNTFTGDLENIEQSYIPFHYILQLFLVDKFLVGDAVSSSQKLIEWIDKKVEGYTRPEKYYDPILRN